MIGTVLVGLPLHFAAAFVCLAAGWRAAQPGGFSRSSGVVRPIVRRWRWLLVAAAVWSAAATWFEDSALAGGRTVVYRQVDGDLRLVGEVVDQSFRQMVGVGLFLAILTSLAIFAFVGFSRAVRASVD